jgi:uncharacterized protein YhbP (UPF0306 family)
MSDSDGKFVRELVQRNRYLTLATVGSDGPWIAPLEYRSDEVLNFYFFSTDEAVHSRHIAENAKVAVAIFDAEQPEYEPAPTIRISGVQFTAVATRLESPYPELVDKQIAEWQLPMPPYAVFRLVPQRWYLPVIDDGVNARREVNLQ